MRYRLFGLVLLLHTAFTAGISAQEPGAADPQASQATPTAPVKEITPGVFQVGAARLEQAARTVTFPAAVNMDNGTLEYLLVTREGPTHESLLVTELAPQDLHVAMLLLGAKGSPAPKGGADVPGQITSDYLKHAPALQGDEISIATAWKDPASGAERSAPVEDLLLYGDPGKPPKHGPWLYTGSGFGYNTGKFMAQVEGIHAALVTNPSALINNPRHGHDDDQGWSPNPKAVPKPETAVTVTIRLLKAGKSEGSRK